MSEPTKQLSKFLSFVLRHNPAAIQLTLDEHGWAAVDELIEKSAVHGNVFTAVQLELVVSTNDKQRFSFSDDHTRIRANQGHSISVDLNLVPQEPPAILYHGTVAKFLPAIQA